MDVKKLLLSKGYFPKELPPAFTTKKFVDFTGKRTLFNATNCIVAPDSRGNLVHPKKGYSRSCKHNLARVDGTNRPLHIPHPTHFYYLCETFKNNWKEIRGHLKKSNLSISTPKTDPSSIRAFIPTEAGVARPKRRMIDRSQGDYLLVTDISNFYGSIYSHSIPWALHTKAVAKRNRTDLNLTGNAIDTYLRNGQDGQTLGTPIGPDTSFVIAELLLSSVDMALQNKHPKITGFRFYDDYELICHSEHAAQQILSDLEDCVSQYELSLNRRKTKIIRLPEVIEQPWVTKLRLFQMPHWKLGEENLIDFANLVFPLSKKFPNDPILRYALVKLIIGKTDDELIPFGTYDRKEFYVPPDAHAIYQQFLIQLFRAEPGLSHLIAGELLRIKENFGELNLALIKDTIVSHIIRYASIKANNEVAWVLWLAIQLGIKLQGEIINKISEIEDNFVAILALDAQDKGLFSKKLDTSLWKSYMTEQDIYSENWLLCYEAAAKGWLQIKDGSNYINNHQCFGNLNKYGVSFYNEDSYENVAETLEKLEINTDLYST